MKQAEKKRIYPYTLFGSAWDFGLRRAEPASLGAPRAMRI
jgi:hypothetical protein